ncbi:MAG: asparagine synthase (glutamine-hydrolyzing), partial [Cyclobacteriaceae bacterium]|nr:asparagine synthase (glutamine-hydrolyzing) [Cyclobacteriaceae bacterium]
MCGITGIFAFNMVGAFHMVNVAKATELLSSRGPDVQDIYNDDRVGLGHRRLSIIDVSAEANQPMWDKSGRYCIIFNGEIYNYKSLRENLIKEGVSFSTEGDTEVLLKLYIAKGKDCLNELNGFFAFSIFDKQNHSLFVARDRFGIKPLLYYYDEDKLLFASEMKSLLAYGIEKKVNFEVLHQYMQLNYVAGDQSMMRGVSKLLPGHYLQIEEGKIEVNKWYELPKHKIQIAESYEDRKKRLAELLEESVQKRLVADVPLGSFLSGGVDSSIVASLASKHKPDLHTFSIGFADEPYFDETKYALSVAKKIGTEHTVFSLTNKDLYQHLESILNYIDEPFADSSAIAVYILSQETKKHATVALSGDGADEMFAGYNKHAAFYRMMHPGFSENMVGALHPLWKLLPKSRSNTITNTFRQLHRFSKGMKQNPTDRYWQWAGFLNEKESLSLLSDQSKSSLQ